MIQVRDVSWVREGRTVLDGVTLAVRPGELVGLVGLNGSGKSSLIRLVCGLDRPSGGFISIDGQPAGSLVPSTSEASVPLALVQQDPADQIVCTLVQEEVAFGPRNLGCSSHEVRERVDAALAAVGLDGFDPRTVHELSGGELQRVALAGALAMHPRYVALDEVTAQLDRSARQLLLCLVRRELADHRHVGVLMAAHDGMDALACDRLVVLAGGHVVWTGTPLALVGRTAAPRWDDVLRQGEYAHAVAALVAAGQVEPDRVRLLEDVCSRLRDGLRGEIDLTQTGTFLAPQSTGKAHQVAMSRAGSGLLLDQVVFTHERAARPALKDVTMAVRQGSCLVLAGRSGSGKTTAACVAAGLLRPDEGQVTLEGSPVRLGCSPSVGLAFQRPEDQFFLESVYDEVAFAPRQQGRDEGEVARCVRDAARAMGLERALLERNPFELSGGQQRRVGLACLYAMHPAAYVLDEPTAGLDRAGVIRLKATIQALKEEGAPVLVISHDVETWLDVADEIMVLNRGQVAWQGAPAELGAQDAAAFERACGLALPPMLQVRSALRDCRAEDGGAR